MTNPTLLRSHSRSLEAQLRVLSASVQSSTTADPAGAYALADVEGLLRGQMDTTDTDIDAVLYQVPPAMDADA